MILVDTGPLVALCNPADAWHADCADRLQRIREPLQTTVPVLTEAFHFMPRNSRGPRSLMELIEEGGVKVFYLEDINLRRAFELMLEYEDVDMDFADASLLAAAESLGVRKVFTIDRGDFAIYRIRSGHRQIALEIVE